MRIYKAVLWAFLLATLLLQTGGQKALAADITFDSFEAAEAAAKKRAEEYQKKMQEHIKNVNEQWEKQQKDLGADSSSPDISKITTRQDGQKSSDTDASKSLENAVNSSINRMKDEMVSKAGPTSTGFAGGSAGYQWSVKFKDGKYVLSDSYNEAEFNTGKKKEAEAPAPVQPEPEEIASGGDSDSDTGSTAEPAAEPSTTAASPEGATASTSPADTAATPADNKPSPAQTTTATKPAAPEEPAKPLTGVDPAPVKLPPPSIRMVIQHPTDFSEEVFASNANSETTANYRLDKFKIPEDTRIKIAVEVGEDVNPEDVSMVVTDDQGDNTPVSAAKLKNYRHMFRVPSDDQYSASVYVNNRKTPGGQQKKILQVAIPVSKVDFESRTIDNQRGSKSGSGAGSISDTSSSGGDAGVNHSSFGKPQAVDLSDLYADPTKVANTAGSGTGASEGDSSASAASSGSEAASTGSDGSGGQLYSGNSAASASGDSDEGAADGSASGSNASDMSDGVANGETSAQSADGAQATAAAGETSNSAGAGSHGDQQQTNSGARYSDTGSGNDQGQGSEDSSGASAVSGDAATDGAASETSGNSAGDETTAGASGNGQDEKLKNQGSAGNKSTATGKEQNMTEEDPFLLAISLRAEAQKVYQSFDFVDGNTQTSSAIKAGGEVIFSLNMGTDVNPESIQIKLSDGSQEIKGNLKRMGESFAYVFKNPTESAFIEVSGKTSKRSFTYKVGIPVK